MNILKTIQSYTLNVWIVWYVNCSSIKLFLKIQTLESSSLLGEKKNPNSLIWYSSHPFLLHNHLIPNKHYCSLLPLTWPSMKPRSILHHYPYPIQFPSFVFPPTISPLGLSPPDSSSNVYILLLLQGPLQMLPPLQTLLCSSRLT